MIEPYRFLSKEAHVSAVVNPKTTDQVTQDNVMDLGSAPAEAMAMLYQSTAQALSLAAHNATAAQQHGYMILQAATVRGIALIQGAGPSTPSGKGNDPAPAH